MLDAEGHEGRLLVRGLSREFVREEMELTESHINKIFQTMMFTKNTFLVFEKSIMNTLVGFLLGVKMFSFT